MKTLAFLTLATALTACAGLDNLGATRIEKGTPKDTEVELAHWAYWNDACQAEPFTTTITQAPANGTAEQRGAVMAIPSTTSSGATTGCADQLVESVKVFYVPNPGFTGSDTVGVEFAGSTGVNRNIYVISVR